MNIVSSTLERIIHLKLNNRIKLSNKDFSDNYKFSKP